MRGYRQESVGVWLLFLGGTGAPHQ